MTGFHIFQRLEEVTADAMNSYLASQVVARFATSAERDAAILAPENGQAAWTPGGGLRLYRSGGTWPGWYPDWMAAWGTQGRVATQTANVGIPTGWGEVISVPSSRYHADRNYVVNATMAVGNETGAPVVIDWSIHWSLSGGLLAEIATSSLGNLERRTITLGFVLPALGGEGVLSVQAKATTSMGATASNGILGARWPVRMSIADSGPVEAPTNRAAPRNSSEWRAA